MNVLIPNEKFPIQKINSFETQIQRIKQNYYLTNKQEILKQKQDERTPEDGLCTIYRIYSENKTYIGSTKMIPDLRFRCHINAYNRYKNSHLGSFCASFLVFDDDQNAKFEILEKVSLEKKAEREAHFISHFRGLTSVVNKNEANKNSIECRNEYMKAYLTDKKNRDQNLAFRKLCKISI